MKVKLDNIKIDITNETIGELVSLIPYITSSFENFIIYNGNIITDIQKTYFKLYDSYKELKIKWKVMEHLNKIYQKEQIIKNELYDNSKDILQEGDSIEMLYLKSNRKYVNLESE